MSGWLKKCLALLLCLCAITGYACAESWVMLLIMALITGIIFKTSSNWTFYES